MKKGDWVRTPRFCYVEIGEVFENVEAANKAGYTEPTHYHDDPGYGILGKSIPPIGFAMVFAAYKK